jgi:hypothetical protein
LNQDIINSKKGDCMKLYDACINYFNGIHQLLNYKNNNLRTNLLALAKIVSYFTVIIPLTFGAMYCAASLKGRATQKTNLTSTDHKTTQAASTALSKSSQVFLFNIPKVSFAQVMNTYSKYYAPSSNNKNLLEYSQSQDFKRHAQSARIYYNLGQLSKSDALRVAFQREPTNIEMESNQYNKKALHELFGYSEGIYNDPTVKKEDGSSFKDQPNTVSIYSETYLWNPPGGNNKIEIACLSLPAPALDTPSQPHYNYYMNQGLDIDKYTQEMAFLFKTIETAVRDNHAIAFNNQGIKRLVLSRFGQNSFLNAVSSTDQAKAHQVFKDQMEIFLKNIADLGVKVVMSEYSYPHGDVWLQDMIVGDIVKTAEPRDLIINAWDPNSAPGNGNDADQSFDGAMGKSTGIVLTQTSWLNEHLRHEKTLVGVK